MGLIGVGRKIFKNKNLDIFMRNKINQFMKEIKNLPEFKRIKFVFYLGVLKLKK